MIQDAVADESPYRPRRTEPEVIAAISSGSGQPGAAEPVRWGFGVQQGLMLVVAGVALGALTGLWVRRVR